jgi:hypothetical protein
MKPRPATHGFAQVRCAQVAVHDSLLGTEPESVNDAREVAGFCYGADKTHHAFLKISYRCTEYLLTQRNA